MYEVNRSVFLLIPLEPFWNWLQSLPGNHLDGPTVAKTNANARIWTPTFSTSGSTSSFPPSSPTSNTNRWRAKPSSPST